MLMFNWHYTGKFFVPTGKAMRFSILEQRHRTGASRSHTSKHRAGVDKRVCFSKFSPRGEISTPLMNIYFCPIYSPALLTFSTVRIAVDTTTKWGTEPFRYVTLHFPEISAAQLRSVTLSDWNRPEIAVFMGLAFLNSSYQLIISMAFRSHIRQSVKLQVEAAP